MCFVLIQGGDEDEDCECKQKSSCLKLCKNLNIRPRRELNISIMLIINCTASLCWKRGKFCRINTDFSVALNMVRFWYSIFFLIYIALRPFLSFRILKSKINVDISRISGIFLKCCWTKQKRMNSIRNSKVFHRILKVIYDGLRASRI